MTPKPVHKQLRTLTDEFDFEAMLKRLQPMADVQTKMFDWHATSYTRKRYSDADCRALLAYSVPLSDFLTGVARRFPNQVQVRELMIQLHATYKVLDTDDAALAKLTDWEKG